MQDGTAERIRIAVLSAGVRTPSSSRRLADRLAEASARALGRSGRGAIITVVEIGSIAREVAEAVTTGTSTPAVTAALATLRQADAVIAVSPVFNGSYSGLFKSFLDLVDPDALRGRPVLIGATGGSVRHALVLDTALRPLFSYLHGLVLPTGVFATSEDWADGGPAEALTARIERAASELADLVAVLPPRRIDQADVLDTADLEDLLRSVD